MSYNNSEFEDIRQDQDIDEPLDGRDSQPAEGSSDAPQNLDSGDPLHGVDQVLEANDEDPLQLDADRPVDGSELEEDSGLDAQRAANAQDQRLEPDEQ